MYTPQNWKNLKEKNKISRQILTKIKPRLFKN